MEGYMEVYYEPWRWRLLEEKRSLAIKIMEVLQALYGSLVTHGSIARGDVSVDSDVDVVILDPPNPSLVELTLEKGGFKVRWKELVQATPTYTPKVYLYLDYKGLLVVSYPLARLRPREREFYKWGGECTLDDLRKGVRTPGVDKRLKLIEPTDRGHRESPVIGREGYVARLLGISVETVIERVRVLTRRREHGRTGVFLKVELNPEDSVEEAVARVARENPMFRRRLEL
ncbi:MAG: nucleotidyltransferase domain-containing protein [Desulfurococcales archaeon]|jgi:predicted nucleotidyltransferase|nr:nucleotidyltransferase domain-containing protein [Desulfurococcaceae archaeon]MDT7865954.1 nucleotidyltransferase domain-containing protein [Desulfurococcales archaeon]